MRVHYYDALTFASPLSRFALRTSRAFSAFRPNAAPTVPASPATPIVFRAAADFSESGVDRDAQSAEPAYVDAQAHIGGGEFGKRTLGRQANVEPASARGSARPVIAVFSSEHGAISASEHAPDVSGRMFDSGARDLPAHDESPQTGSNAEIARHVSDPRPDSVGSSVDETSLAPSVSGESVVHETPFPHGRSGTDAVDEMPLRHRAFAADGSVVRADPVPSRDPAGAPMLRMPLSVGFAPVYARPIARAVAGGAASEGSLQQTSMESLQLVGESSADGVFARRTQTAGAPTFVRLLGATLLRRFRPQIARRADGQGGIGAGRVLASRQVTGMAPDSILPLASPRHAVGGPVIGTLGTDTPSSGAPLAPDLLAGNTSPDALARAAATDGGRSITQHTRPHAGAATSVAGSVHTVLAEGLSRRADAPDPTASTTSVSPHVERSGVSMLTASASPHAETGVPSAPGVLFPPLSSQGGDLMPLHLAADLRMARALFAARARARSNTETAAGSPVAIVQTSAQAWATPSTPGEERSARVGAAPLDWGSHALPPTNVLALHAAPVQPITSRELLRAEAPPGSSPGAADLTERASFATNAGSAPDIAPSLLPPARAPARTHIAVQAIDRDAEGLRPVPAMHFRRLASLNTYPASLHRNAIFMQQRERPMLMSRAATAAVSASDAMPRLSAAPLAEIRSFARLPAWRASIGSDMPMLVVGRAPADLASDDRDDDALTGTQTAERYDRDAVAPEFLWHTRSVPGGAAESNALRTAADDGSGSSSTAMRSAALGPSSYFPGALRQASNTPEGILATPVVPAELGGPGVGPAQPGTAQGNASTPGQTNVDLDELAERTLKKLVRMLAIEKERRGAMS